MKLIDTVLEIALFVLIIVGVCASYAALGYLLSTY